MCITNSGSSRRRSDREQAWDEMYSRLAKYKETYGDCIVKRSDGRYLKLARWVNKQRNERDSMSQKRKEKLSSIGFVWSRPKHSWQNMYKSLLDYRNLYGNCLVPWKYPADPKLGRWVDHQRRLGICLTVERKKLLDKIGFVWKINESWDEMFLKLVEYKNTKGDCLVPQRYWTDPKLGNWVRLQRVRRKSLSPMQTKKLTVIGFVWDARKGKY